MTSDDPQGREGETLMSDPQAPQEALMNDDPQNTSRRQL